MVQNEGEANSTLTGIIKKLLMVPTVTINESISEYRYKVDVKIQWYDNTKEKTLLTKIILDLVPTD